MSQDSTPVFETIRLEMTGSVATLTLNRPQRLNAAPPAMFVEIGAALKQLPALGARALLITGEGRAFCSGADLQGRSTDTTTSRGAQTYKSLSESYSPTMVALSKLSVPVIAAVNGVAAGIGCSLALAADFTLAARSAYFLEAFVNIGLVPDVGSTWLLPRLAGRARAQAMMMLGERIPAETALDWGMVYKVVDDADLAASTRAVAEKLAKGPTKSYALIRQGIRDCLDVSLSEGLMVERRNQLLAGRSADFVEGVSAFLQKRPAAFTGK